MSYSPSRLLEDVGFLAAVGVGVYAGIQEANTAHTPGIEHAFPWALLIIMAILAAPKTLGRVTAGKFWEAVAARIGGKGA